CTDQGRQGGPRKEISSMSLSQSTQNRAIPTLAVTLGDVAGIGPEITAKMLMNHHELRQRARLFVIGDAAALRKAVRALGENEDRVRVVEGPEQASNHPGLIEVMQAGPDLGHVPLG